MSNVEKRIAQNGKQDCCGCKLCEEICPQKCICMKYDKEGFWYPYVDEKKCTQCGLCNQMCPNVYERNVDFEPQVYAAYALDTEICKSSTSGGLFQLLARENIISGGVVYGAAYDENLKVRHMRATTLDELKLLLGSKYVQSDLQEIFPLVKDDLRNKKRVLFSGTPCQIAAIKLLVGDKYDNLLLVDLVCHGVPSPEIWREYLESQIKGDQKVSHFVFRSKEQEGDWENFKCKKEYGDANCEREGYGSFLYGRAFAANLTLRPSCYECQYLAMSSGADITLGDFWGIKHKYPEYYNPWGVSVVSVNSIKGNQAFQEIAGQCKVRETDVYYLEQGNGAFHSEKRSLLREDYLQCVQKSEKKLPVVEQYLDVRKYNIHNVLLFGSYNTRVAINETKENLLEQYSYSSLLSLMSINENINEVEEMPNGFVEQMLYKDKYRCFIKEIENLSKRADYLIIDLLEERFPVECVNGIYTTQNIDCFNGSHVRERDYQKEFETWKKACDLFVTHIKKFFQNKQIIFVESYLCSHWGMHGKYEQFKNHNEIEEFNKYIRGCNDYFIKKSGVEQIIKVPEKLQYSQKYHRFGCKPYHLNYDAYQSMGKQLRRYFRE